MKYIFLVNGMLVPNPVKAEPVEAESAEQAVDKWLIRFYGSVMSSRAPYNVSAVPESNF